jgi:hypothetical protein
VWKLLGGCARELQVGDYDRRSCNRFLVCFRDNYLNYSRSVVSAVIFKLSVDQELCCGLQDTLKLNDIPLDLVVWICKHLTLVNYF